MKDIKAVVTLGDFPGVAPVSLRAVQLKSLRSFPEGVHLTGERMNSTCILRADKFFGKFASFLVLSNDPTLLLQHIRCSTAPNSFVVIVIIIIIISSSSSSRWAGIALSV